MVNLPKKFNIGDKVFAKVRGYPPWPARIEKIIDPNTKNSRYNVYFYGTGETALCKVEELFDYLENKAKYGKTLRRKFFNEGIQQLEEELGIAPAAAEIVKSKDVNDISTSQEVYLKNDDGANESVTATSSDTESKLVIDEREPKKTVKRKMVSSQNNTPEASEAKKKRVGRPSMSETKKQQALQQSQIETPKQPDATKDTGLDSQDEETSGKEMISRSGRKIKPKRFTDFADTPEVQKPEHTGRAKMKQKFEDNENLSSVNNTLPKKKASLEKNNSNTSSPPNKQDTDTMNSSILTRTFAGEYVGIKMKLKGDKTRDNWDWSAAREALKLKKQLENGEVLPEQVKDKLDFHIAVSEEEKRATDKKDNNFSEKCKEKWLKVQQQLLLTDKQVRCSLSLEEANPDECLEAMENYLQLAIDPLMLKTNPIIVDTIKKLRCYVGNLEAWDYSEDKVIIFKKKAEIIRQKAEKIYNRFKSMFAIPEGQPFWQTFNDEVTLYQKLTENLSDEDKWCLMNDPCKDNEGLIPKKEETGGSNDKVSSEQKIKHEVNMNKEVEESDESKLESDSMLSEKISNENVATDLKMETV